jgi:site-specific DNA-cytosine methylase
MPKACVFENVPSFGPSTAGYLVKKFLQHLGYHLTEHVIQPHAEWGEPSDRKRWILVATLIPGFKLAIPKTPMQGTISGYLDPEDITCDQTDANHIAKTIEGLRRHNERHKTLGHGFALSTINRSSTKVPTIPKSYHKINTGPFVETPYGPRMLRLHEVERIMGSESLCAHYATGVQILGQGVQTRVWREILNQVTSWIQNPDLRGNGGEKKEPVENRLNQLTNPEEETITIPLTTKKPQQEFNLGI